MVATLAPVRPPNRGLQMRSCSFRPTGGSVVRAVLSPLLLVSILGCAAEPRAAMPLAQAGHSMATTPDAAPAGNDQPPDVDLTGALFYQLVAAEIALQRGDPGSAFATYLAVARQTRDARVARRATEVAIAGRAGAQALEAAQLWRELAPRSPDARQALALLLVGGNRLAEAEPLLAAQLQEAARPAADLAQMQRVLARADDRAAAFALLDRLAAPLLQQPAMEAEVRLTLAVGAHLAGLTQRAVTEARAALALRPNDARSAMTAAQLLARPGGAEDSAGRGLAIQLLEEFLRSNAEAAEVRVGYARLLLSDGKLDAARMQFELVLSQDNKQLDALYALGVLALDDKAPRARANDFFQRYLKAIEESGDRSHDPDPAYLNLARIAEDERRFEEALQWLARVDDGPQLFAARLRQAIVLAKTQRVDEARKLLSATAAESDEQRVQLVIADGQVLREAHRHQEAYEVLAAAQDSSPDDTALLYDTAMAAERVGKFDEMERLLRRLMVLKPDEPHAFNALGYTLADRNVRLPEALELIGKALQLAPDDAYILDSMGWVHFRLGNFAKAREFLERAFALRPEAEVGAHLGEVQWAQGEHEAARRIWRQAHAGAPDNETLTATLARLQVRL